ncbi:hypothetical protein [Flavobacterium sp. XGLA_31]|uniref:hypothetical protein n=1 Tax=Flavobacterium sp. XGLA_31 TaxID=3447666 RepID=UPI003F33881D
MILIVSKYLVPKGFKAFTVYPFVFLNDKDLKRDKVLLNHERIHLRQQLELLVIPFFVLYILEYGLRLLQFKNGSTAYKNISFEREAYQEEKDEVYLVKRKPYNFLFFLNQN